MYHAIKPLQALVIEDCEDDYDLLLLKLRQAGFEPMAIRVETIAEVEDALARQDWQIIISDFDLPGFDGLRALDLVRAHTADIPFFLVSGVIDEEQAVAAMRAGVQDYFFKGKLARLGPAVSRELHEADQRAQRRQAQAELDRDRDLLRHDRIRFVDVMSHELRTPLNIINVAAGMLARYSERMDASARQERISEIQDAIVRMTRVIDKVLLTSRLELRRWDLRSDTFDPAVWCKEFLDHEFTDSDQRRRIRLQMRNLPARVAMDQRVIEIALQNLLTNAIKYSPPDAPVELEVRTASSGGIEFLVRDYGIGIPDADIAHVLDSFYRGSNVGDVPGTGLGLALVKNCTDLHGGTIEIQSQPGQGTCVRMCLADWLRQDASRELPASQAEVLQG
ncbi:MAG TPA: HAMP domain-containing sensor histidine kinase [Bryobacteraceae bacterium]|nr:HAMP domain-containing sensor histidine kinase [Bryobacteraceae bacterium]